MTQAERAQTFFDAGLNVMPLIGKRPIGEWAALQKERTNIERTVRYLNTHPDANLAIICGSISGVTVVDVDIHEGFSFELFANFLKRYPTPVVVETGSGGYHLYYAYEAVKNAVKVTIDGLKLDIRSQGGYVVAPGSVHPETGRRYTFINMNKPGEEPDFDIMVSLLENLPLLPQPVSLALSPSRRKLPNDWKEIITTIGQGSRNQTAAAIIGKLTSVLPPSEWKSIVWPLVSAWNTTFCSPPMDPQELRTVYESICKKHLAGLAWGGPPGMVPVTQQKTESP